MEGNDKNGNSKMNLPLSNEQIRELDESTLEYLLWRNKSIDTAQLANALQIDAPSLQDDTNRLPLLARKWTAIARLQRRIMSLEQSIRELRENSAEVNAPTLLPGSSESARLAWLAPEQPRVSITLESPVTGVRLHPELAVVFVSTEHGRLHCFDLMDTTLPLSSLQAHTRAITSVDVYCWQQTTYVVTGSKDMQVRVFTWNVDKGLKLLRSFAGHEHVVSGVRIWVGPRTANVGGGSLLLASCSRDTSVKIWDVGSGWCLKSFQPHSDWVRCLDVYGEFLITGCQDSTLRLTHWPSGNGLSVGLGHEFPVESIRFIGSLQEAVTPEGKTNNWLGYCVSTSRDRTSKIWLLPQPRRLPQRPPVPHSTDAQLLCKWTLRGHDSWIKAVTCRGDHVLTASDDRSVMCWNWTNGQSVKKWEHVHQGFVTCIDLDDSNHPMKRKIMVTGGIDCKCHIFMQ